MAEERMIFGRRAALMRRGDAQREEGRDDDDGE